jgi:hypothetical protein
MSRGLAFSLRTLRENARPLWLSGTKNLRSVLLRFQDFQRAPILNHLVYANPNIALKRDAPFRGGFEGLLFFQLR